MTDKGILEVELGLTHYNYDCTVDNNNRITTLSIYDSEYEELHLRKNFLAYLSGFTSLKSLTIEASEVEIDDLTPLAKLTQLESIEINYSKVKDLSVVSNFPNLQHLFLPDAEIEDISVLGKINSLKSLSLHGNQISDITAIANHKLLNTLSLGNNKIADISILSTLTSLSSLSVNDNHIDDISALSFIASLNHLNIASNNISNLSPIAKHTALMNLDISNNKVESCHFLRNFILLQILNISNNNISDISFLTNNVELGHLNISHNPINDISAVKHLSKLQYLVAANLERVDVSHISDLHELMFLKLEGNNITDLAFLQQLPKLTSITLNNNNIVDTAPIQQLKKLREINLKNNRITLFDGIGNFHNLTRLDLRENPFGGKLYLRYLNQYEGEPQANYIELIDELTKYFIDRKEYDKALSYCIYANNIYKLKIQLQKLKNTQQSESYFYRYYAVECLQVIQSLNTKDNSDEFRELKEEYITTVKNSSLHDKDAIIQAATSNSYYRYDKFGEYATFLMNDPDPKPHPELLLYIGDSVANRQNLQKSLFVYRELVLMDHPLKQTLYNKLSSVLESNFAYTPEERKDYEKWKHMLEHVEEARLPQFNFLQHYGKHYNVSYSDNRRVFERNKPIDWQMILRYIILALLLIKGCTLFFN